MTVISKGHEGVITRLTPGGDLGLAHLSDDELLANTRRLVGKTNQLFAALLAHLAEVEARGVHRTRRCASLYTYCIYELRFSEDAAARRSAAARLVKEFPPLFEAIANGELHLTGLLMIGPHLTSANFADVLGRAKFRTKKELSRLLRELNPLPQVPDCIEPIGPTSPQALRNPTWEEYVTSLSPVVRELPVGERPRDWAGEVERGNTTLEGGVAQTDGLPVGPVPQNLAPITGPQHYQVRFSTVEEHAHLVERAQALLARSRPGLTLGELHLEGMKLLVASLEKQKFAITDRPQPRKKAAPRRPETTRSKSETAAGTGTAAKSETAAETEAAAETRQRGDNGRESLDPTRQRGETDVTTKGATRQRGETDATPRQRSRYIPAVERREVYERDAGRCTYVDARGERCCETRYLELHHLQAFAKHGANAASNLTLRCTAHNALAAEVDFGRQLIAKRRDATRHEALSAQEGSSTR